MARMGAAVLGLGDRIGESHPGQEAALVVLDPAATQLLARRTWGASIAQTLFALQILGDDRVVERTDVAGKCHHDRNHAGRARV